MIISFYNVGGTPGPGPTPTPTGDTATTALLNSIVDGSVTELHLGTGCTSVRDGVFFDCTDLTSVTMDSVTTIGKEAFRGCTALTDVVFSSGLTSIGDNAFIYSDTYGDMHYNHLTFNNPVPPTLGEYVFDVEFGQTVNLDVPTAGLCAYTEWLSTYQLNPKQFIINYDRPEVITYVTIDNEIVSGVGSTQNFLITVDDGGYDITTNYMVFASALTETPAGFVSGSTAITSMVFNDSLTGIGANSFTDCSSLGMITFNTATPPTVGTDAFSGVPSAGTIFCPASAQSAYQSWLSGIAAISGWSVNNWVRLDNIDNTVPFDAIAWSVKYDDGDDKWVAETSGLTTEEMSSIWDGTEEYGWFGDHRWSESIYGFSYQHDMGDPSDPSFEPTSDVDKSGLTQYQITVDGKSTISYVLDLTTMTDYVPLYGASSDPSWYTMVYDGDSAPDRAIVFVRLV